MVTQALAIGLGRSMAFVNNYAVVAWSGSIGPLSRNLCPFNNMYRA